MLGRGGSEARAAFPVCWSRSDLVFLLLILLFITLEAIVLAPVYWNSSNPIFKSSKNDHIVEVNPGDDIDFICPFYPLEDNESHYEYYLIYSVPESEYKLCSLSTDASLILNCSQPHQRRRYTIIFQTRQSIPNAPEYKPGETYYYITTSTSKVEGINNADHGACHQQNMKLMIRINSDNPDYFFFDENYNDVENEFYQITEAPRPPTRRHHNKRPQVTRPPTFEDNHQPIVPRHRGHKFKVMEGNFNNRKLPHNQLQQKTHRRQTQKNLTSVSDQQQQHHHQQEELYRSNKQVSQSGGKQIFHYTQVPRSAISTSGHKMTSFPLTCFTISVCKMFASLVTSAF